MDKFVVSETGITAYEPGHIHHFPLGAIAIWAELLDVTDIIEVVNAIIHKDNLGDAEDDDISGENAWTEVFNIKAHLESVRETEAEIAALEGKGSDPRSPKLRSAMKVRDELMKLSGGERNIKETILPKCQRKIKDQLGIPFVDSEINSTRSAKLTCEALSPKGPSELDTSDRQKLREALSSCGPDCGSDCKSDHLGQRMNWLSKRKLLYTHQITGRARDPFEEDYLIYEPKKKEVDLQDIVDRYNDKVDT